MHDSGRAATPTARLFAWTGAGLFLLSLGYFIYRYSLVFGRPVDGPLQPAVVLWNVVLFSAFALHHSVFARERFRRTVTQVFGPLERSLYVWIASFLFIVVCRLWLPLPGIIWDVGGAAAVALLLLQIGGITFSVYSAAAIDIWELAGIRQINARLPTTNSSAFAHRDPDALRRDLAGARNEARTSGGGQQFPTPNSRFPIPESQGAMEFKTTGPYGLVRHPIYLGWFLIVFGVGTMTMTRFVFAVLSCAYLLIAIPFEERSLRRSSNGAYDRYMQQVRRKLVPGIY